MPGLLRETGRFRSHLCACLVQGLGAARFVPKLVLLEPRSVREGSVANRALPLFASRLFAPRRACWIRRSARVGRSEPRPSRGLPRVSCSKRCPSRSLLLRGLAVTVPAAGVAQRCLDSKRGCNKWVYNYISQATKQGPLGTMKDCWAFFGLIGKTWLPFPRI